ncbi:hypothetical protein HSB1_24970 [Halogranum salarium B-1]|uniref:Uncharacterized protein n=1 Tax=Halogranum salarium B-1 TaxID=1210908 RepID=J3JFB3_9EURY|nr:hypothetical protein HSB1_24970 [Halogranum salarium B-1]
MGRSVARRPLLTSSRFFDTRSDTTDTESERPGTRHVAVESHRPHTRSVERLVNHSLLVVDGRPISDR